jgi:hypothetical protein
LHHVSQDLVGDLDHASTSFNNFSRPSTIYQSMVSTSRISSAGSSSGAFSATCGL